MYFTDHQDEQVCPICLEALPFYHVVEQGSICKECQKQFVVLKKKIKVDGIDWYILYEYNSFLERLFFQYKEQKDRVLAPLFLENHWDWIHAICRNKTVCLCTSGQAQRQERGFEPLVELFKKASFPVYSPLYKSLEYKQSQQSKANRNKWSKSIKRKECFPLLKGDLILVDDVCTTSATLKRSISLLKPKAVFVLAAHPLWLDKIGLTMAKRKGVC